MLLIMVALKFLLLHCFVSSAFGEQSISYFTSVKKLRELAAIDLELFSKISELSEKENLALKDELSLWSDEVAKIQSNLAKYVGNPLNAYKLIHRSVIDISHYEKVFPDLRKKLKNNETKLPTEADLVGAVKGLARLQKFYKLRTEDFTRGIFNGVVTDGKLSSQEMDTISEQLKGMGKWEDLLAEGYQKLSQNVNYQTDIDILFDESFTKDGTFSYEKEQMLMQQMCRGEISKTLSEQSILYCEYRSTNAFTKLAPFKVEVVNLEPLVFIIIDILSDDEINEIMQIYNDSKSTEDSTVGEAKGRAVNHKLRVAAIDKLQEKNHEIFQRLSRRMDDVTQLDLVEEEPYQYFDYGIGGHFSLHWDFPIKMAIKEGYNYPIRVATLLFYLSDIELGGATVFPYVKTLIPTVKGSASFWYNIKDSGNDDYWSRHAGCPVLLGNKVILKKWIFLPDQVLRRPCLTRDIEEDVGVIFQGVL